MMIRLTVLAFFALVSSSWAQSAAPAATDTAPAARERLEPGAIMASYAVPNQQSIIALPKDFVERWVGKTTLDVPLKSPNIGGTTPLGLHVEGLFVATVAGRYSIGVTVTDPHDLAKGINVSQKPCAAQASIEGTEVLKEAHILDARNGYSSFPVSGGADLEKGVYGLVANIACYPLGGEENPQPVQFTIGLIRPDAIDRDTAFLFHEPRGTAQATTQAGTATPPAVPKIAPKQ